MHIEIFFDSQFKCPMSDMGYILRGAASSPMLMKAARQFILSKFCDMQNRNDLIGAYMVDLAAGRHLQKKHSFKVTILEARDRIGGGFTFIGRWVRPSSSARPSWQPGDGRRAQRASIGLAQRAGNASLKKVESLFARELDTLGIGTLDIFPMAHTSQVRLWIPAPGSWDRALHFCLPCANCKSGEHVPFAHTRAATSRLRLRHDSHCLQGVELKLDRSSQQQRDSDRSPKTIAQKTSTAFGLGSLAGTSAGPEPTVIYDPLPSATRAAGGGSKSSCVQGKNARGMTFASEERKERAHCSEFLPGSLVGATPTEICFLQCAGDERVAPSRQV